MNFDALFDSLPSDGWLSRAEAELLWRTVQRDTGPILEVGCYQGRSTVLLAASGRQVHSVDPFDNFNTELSGAEVRRRWTANMESRGIANVTLHVMPVELWSVVPVVTAYLDGDHTARGTIAQLNAALRAGATRIMVHDVNDSGEGKAIKRICLNRLGPWEERVERLAVWSLSSTG